MNEIGPHGMIPHYEEPMRVQHPSRDEIKPLNELPERFMNQIIGASSEFKLYVTDAQLALILKLEKQEKEEAYEATT